MEEQEGRDEVEGGVEGEDVEAHLLKEALATGAAASAFFAASTAHARPIQPPDVQRAAEPAQIVGVDTGLPNASSVSSNPAKPTVKKAHKSKKAHKAKKAHKSSNAPRFHVGRNPNIDEK